MEHNSNLNFAHFDCKVRRELNLFKDRFMASLYGCSHKRQIVYFFASKAFLVKISLSEITIKTYNSFLDFVIASKNYLR